MANFEAFNPIDANDNNLNPNEWYCPHGIVGYKQSNSAKNPGRYFLCCPKNYNDPDKCKWLGWQDELGTDNQVDSVAMGKIPEPVKTSHYDNKKRKGNHSNNNNYTSNHVRLDQKTVEKLFAEIEDIKLNCQAIFNKVNNN